MPCKKLDIVADTWTMLPAPTLSPQQSIIATQGTHGITEHGRDCSNCLVQKSFGFLPYEASPRPRFENIFFILSILEDSPEQRKDKVVKVRPR